MSERTTFPRPLYDPRRALEHIQTVPHITPLRLFAILFPLWDIEITAVQDEGRPYELLERYIERGIVEGELSKVEELSRFFRLQEGLVHKILHFLQGIGHIQNNQGRWELTPLGRRSYQEGTNYVAMEKRMLLNFDAFQAKPLLKEHYDRKKVRLISAEDLPRVQKVGAAGTRFRPLTSLELWNVQTLKEVEACQDRDRYNIPPEAHQLQFVSQGLVHLPMYIIEARKAHSSSSGGSLVQNNITYVVYTGIHDLRDPYFERIVNNTPAIRDALSGEKDLDPSRIWYEWLNEKNIEGVVPLERADGTWLVILPAWIFADEKSSFSAARIGDYEMRRGYFMQIWCEDAYQRRRAVLDRTLRRIKNQQKTIDIETIMEQLRLLSTQLETREMDLSDLRYRAQETGQHNLVAIIDDLSAKKQNNTYSKR